MFRPLLVAALLAVLPVAALAQGAQIGFGNPDHDSSLPVEVTADQLDVNQKDGTAKFTGNVIVGQGVMRMTGDVVHVEYGENLEGETEIQRLHAVGNVTLFNGLEAAEGDEAVYTLDTGVVVMTGNVLLTQGENAMAGDRLSVNLDTGTGVMEGRVKVIFTPEEDPEAGTGQQNGEGQ